MGGDGGRCIWLTDVHVDDARQYQNHYTRTGHGDTGGVEAVGCTPTVHARCESQTLTILPLHLNIWQWVGQVG